MPTRIPPILLLASFLLGPVQSVAPAATDIKEAATAAAEFGDRLKARAVGPLEVSTRGYSGEVQFSVPKEGVEVSVASVEINHSGVVNVKVDVTQAARMKLDIVRGAFSLPNSLQVEAEGIVTMRISLEIERSNPLSGPLDKAKVKSVDLERVSWVLIESPKGLSSEDRSRLSRLLLNVNPLGFTVEGGTLIEKFNADFAGRQPATK